MKNLVNKYQVPTSGWDYWYVSDDEWWYSEEEEEFIPIQVYNRYRDNPVNFLPLYQSMGWDEWNNYSRRHYRRHDEHCKKAQAILEHSEGMHISVVRRKVMNALKYTRAHRDRETRFMSWSLDTYEVEGGKMYFKDLMGSYTRRNSYIRSTRGLLVENMEGIIERHLYNPRKRKPKNFRKHYEYQQWRRKSDKENRKDRDRMGHFYLTLLNKPELYGFFQKIKEEYDHLNEIERNSHRDPPVKKGRHDDKWHYWEMYKWRSDRKAFTPARRKRRDKIRQDLDDMMLGNFSTYYSSKENLYSLYKECHHFESINH